MTADLKQDSPAMRALLVIGALVLMGFGVQQMLLGWHKRPLDIAQENQVQTTPVTPVDQGTAPTAFYLDFDGASRRWVFRDTAGKNKTTLPVGLPEPPGFEVPSRAMDLGQWQRFFTAGIASGKIPMSQATLAAMQAVKMGSSRPFSRIGKANVKIDIKDDKQQEVSVQIPAELNPKTAIFEREMLAWQASVRTALRASRVERQGYRVSSRHPGKGNQAKLLFTSIARNRVLSRDFGRKRQDILIYLQVLCNFYSVELKIDGITGPRTRQSIDDFAFLVLPEGKARTEYRQLLRPWIGS